MTLAKRIPLPKLPSHMAFNAASNMVFITQQGSDQVSAIDLSTQTEVDAAGRQAAGRDRHDAG
jgi:DNA-binding beta-propeller fold protein YncE